MKVRRGGAGRGVRIVLLLCMALCLVLTGLRHAAVAGEKWPGVDESVVEKIAGEHGREAVEPLVNTDQGDLLLFVFLTAGAAAGFMGGYFWRMLTAERGPERRAKEGPPA